MEVTLDKPLERLTFDAATLLSQYPPRLRHRNKKAVFAAAFPPGGTAAGTVVYSRWAAMKVPEVLPEVLEGPGEGSRAMAVECRADVYDYAPTQEPEPKLEWHVNFADPDLFVAYGGGLFAQDEMQVAEHPVLASIKEAIQSTGQIPMTVDYGKPTPVLVRGAQRRVAVATDANPAEGRPRGLYGNRFAAAPVDVIERATRRVEPPTITNLIAIAAPSGGGGAYSRDDVDYVMQTAYTGFAAAGIETKLALGDSAETVLHTGHWGCGAFGGHRVLMGMLQLLSARLAGVGRLIFHAFDPAGAAAFTEARVVLNREWAAAVSAGGGVNMLLDRLVALGCCWGVSDGN